MRKRYKCKICLSHYWLESNEAKVRSMRNLSGVCTSIDCMAKHSLNLLDKARAKQRLEDKREWRQKKKMMKESLGQKKDLLQDEINRIARYLDRELPCIARPMENTHYYDAGHVYSRGAHPSLKYHLWNVHKQGVKSNRDKGGEQLLMLEGIEFRYGLDRREYVESLPSKYPRLNMTMDEKAIALKEARKIYRELERGAEYDRDYINERLGIYK